VEGLTEEALYVSSLSFPIIMPLSLEVAFVFLLKPSIHFLLLFIVFGVPYEVVTHIVFRPEMNFSIHRLHLRRLVKEVGHQVEPNN
jgi:hypothetical protein